MGRWGARIEKEDKNMSSNIKQCLYKVADSHFTVAVKVMGSFRGPPQYGHTTKILEAKHPYIPLPLMPLTSFSDAPLEVDVDTIFKCIKSFIKGTSCGKDGLCAHHILDELGGEGSIVA